jgi:type VI secretion system secreted protein VgrG
MLSAIVVGASGQEIHSDEHRRVRVQFRWDREHLFDEESSCYVRVMQTWAGQGFGSLFLPRVGMEVAVMFLDGDPDRPMIAGCLYDQDNTPPYTTEADWTKSTLRSKSSPFPKDGDDHFNELRFEDAAGSEEVFLHAEKDLNEVVKHDHSTHVRRNQSNTVDVDQHETIGRDQAIDVNRDRYARVVGKETSTVEQRQETHHLADHHHTVGGNMSQAVTGDATLDYNKRRTVTVHGRETETYQDGRDVSVNSFDRELVTGPKRVSVNGTSDLDVAVHHRIKKDGGAEVVIANGVIAEAVGDITLCVGSNRISISPNGDIRIHGTQLFLSNDGSSIAMTSDGITLACGQSSIELTPMGVTTSGTQLTSSATADHTITGMIVRIN